MVNFLRVRIERLSKSKPFFLRLGGILITILIVTISGFSGWLIERLVMVSSPYYSFLGAIIVIISLASTLATRSLRDSVLAVLSVIPKESDDDDALNHARGQLNHIVGRDVWSLDKSEILRATAETASENSVDGVFGPLFWMLIGAILWRVSADLPGPLALALSFKASSTIDSMIGYKHGTLRWIGTAGARLDDYLTWIPCRCVLLTLPLISQPWRKIPSLIKESLIEGSNDPSPNAGISEAIYAHCVGIKMGGRNVYNSHEIYKPILSPHSPEASIESIKKLLNLSLRLELSWLVTTAILTCLISLY